MKQKLNQMGLLLGIACLLTAGCTRGAAAPAQTTPAASPQASLPAETIPPAGSPPGPALETASPEAGVDWAAIDCSGGERVHSGSAQGREIGTALQRGLARYPDFQPLFFPQIYDPFGSPLIYQLKEWAVVSTAFQWIEGAQFILQRTPAGYEYFDYFTAGSFSQELPAEQEFERIAGQWPNAPAEVIACLPWAEIGIQPAPEDLEKLAGVDCSEVEWIDPRSQQGREIGERLLSVRPQPPAVEDTFKQVGPIEKVGDWFLYQAEENIGTLYVLGPTSAGSQFFGEGWMRMSGRETIADIQAHLLARLPEAPTSLAACFQAEPWLFK